MRYVVREGKVRGEGGYACRDREAWWTFCQRAAHPFTLKKARAYVAQWGGHVVRLVPKTAPTRKQWDEMRTTLGNQAGEILRLRDRLDEERDAHCVSIAEVEAKVRRERYRADETLRQYRELEAAARAVVRLRSSCVAWEELDEGEGLDVAIDQLAAVLGEVSK